VKKSKSLVINKAEGTSFWQPGRSGGFVTIKASSWNLENPKHTLFIDELAPNDEVREHSHSLEDEIFICLSGEGIFYIDGKPHDFMPESIAYISAGTKHGFKNIGSTPLKVAVIISPGGLEERLRLLGKPKNSDNEFTEKFTSELGNVNSV